MEALREACALGDVDGVASILQRGVIDVNDRHAMNGWTALHWASKRGHSTIVDLLLKVVKQNFVRHLNICVFFLVSSLLLWLIFC